MEEMSIPLMPADLLIETFSRSSDLMALPCLRIASDEGSVAEAQAGPDAEAAEAHREARAAGDEGVVAVARADGSLCLVANDGVESCCCRVGVLGVNMAQEVVELVLRGVVCDGKEELLVRGAEHILKVR